MLKKISQIKNVSKISKNSQSQINGGFVFVNSCSSNSQRDCNHSNGCQWFGCYCGPNTPHIGPLC